MSGLRANLRGICVILCCILIFAVPSGVASPPIEPLQQVQQDIEKQRSGLEQQRDRIRTLEQGAQTHLEGLQRNLKTTSTELSKIETKLKRLKQEVAQLESKLADTRVAYQHKVEVAVARLRFLQRQPKSYGLAVLLDSQNFSEFLQRRHQLKLVYQVDRKAVEQMKAKAEELHQQKRQIEQKKNEIALSRQELLAQKSDVNAQAELQQELIQRLKTDRLALEAAQAQLKRDSEGITFLIRQRVAVGPSGVPQILRLGQMLLPNDGPISSAFGWRTHPILGDQRFHSGIDFASDYGSVIFAASDGVVIFAGWYGGYGNAVIVEHSNGITTLYAHASELYVSEGQSVKAGQAIATVGSTGLSTGPHLHFEVREDGEPVDPMQYLS